MPTNIFLRFFYWLADQWDWVKSFVSEPQLLANGKLKGSSKRLAVMVVIFMFGRAINQVGIKNEWKVVPDIPEMWLILIGGIIGLDITSRLLSKNGNGKNGKHEEKPV